MTNEQIQYIQSIAQSSPNEILIKKTGWEDIQLDAHLHDNKTQIIYTYSGTLHIQIGEERYFVPEKHIAWIPKEVMHEVSSNNRHTSLVIFYVAFPKEEIRHFQIFACNQVIAENLKFIASRTLCIRKTENADFFHYSYFFLKLLPQVSPKEHFSLISLTLPNDPRLRPVLEYIIEHATENLTIELVSAEFGFSVRNLSRLFKKSGIRFSSYLNKQRITRAIEMFADKKCTMQEIAFSTGFTTPSHFNRVFKQITGTSPGNFVSQK